MLRFPRWVVEKYCLLFLLVSLAATMRRRLRYPGRRSGRTILEETLGLGLQRVNIMNFPIDLNQALSGGNLVALPLALAGGVLAGMSPCCLALYPAAAGACCSVESQQTLRRPFGNAVAFILGIAISVAA